MYLFPNSPARRLLALTLLGDGPAPTEAFPTGLPPDAEAEDVVIPSTTEKRAGKKRRVDGRTTGLNYLWEKVREHYLNHIPAKQFGITYVN